MPKLILASTSFRRQELITWLGLPVEICAPDFDESAVNHRDFPNVEEYVKTLAVGKAMSVVPNFPEALIIGGDTVVEQDGEVLGKPNDLDEAREMLRFLSGKTHRICSAVCVIDSAQLQLQVKVECPFVSFKNLSDQDIEAYIQTSESMGKAGGYAIQGQGKNFVQKIEGSTTAAIGLPLLPLVEMLKVHNVTPLTNVPEMIHKSLGVNS